MLAAGARISQDTLLCYLLRHLARPRICHHLLSEVCESPFEAYHSLQRFPGPIYITTSTIKPLSFLGDHQLSFGRSHAI